MTIPILQTHDLTIGYRHGRKLPRIVAEALNVTLRQGELVCLLGPNGAGKSTLLRTMAGLQAPLHGRISLHGDDLTHLTPAQVARRLSIVLTERIDAGAMRAYGLVALGRHPYTNWAGQLSAEDEGVVRWALTAVGAADLAGRQINTLSDGERQKVMIARALAQEPALILLDEPTAYLDLPRRVEIMRILRQLARREGRAILLSTHDLDLALRTADQLWLMAADGSLQTGAPEDLVLSGAFGRTFPSDGVAFDLQTGSFRLLEQPIGRIDLAGNGAGAFWTMRALERAGFAVERGRNGAPALVEVLNGDGRYRWQLNMNGQSQTCLSLQALLDVLGNGR
ncbi:MAG: ABC transporter ATP-binding protein [Chloroflexi bacterium]|nr:ABC transporter ATP-binding protein [Chloroflexota bacterium]